MKNLKESIEQSINEFMAPNKTKFTINNYRKVHDFISNESKLKNYVKSIDKTSNTEDIITAIKFFDYTAYRIVQGGDMNTLKYYFDGTHIKAEAMAKEIYLQQKKSVSADAIDPALVIFRELIKDSINIDIAESLVNESAYAELQIFDDEPKTDEIAIGIIRDDYNKIGLIIGGCFKGGDKAAQKKAESVVKKFGLKITQTYEDYYEELMDGDMDIEGESICYFVSIEDFNKKTGVEAHTFGTDYLCVQAIYN